MYHCFVRSSVIGALARLPRALKHAENPIHDAGSWSDEIDTPLEIDARENDGRRE